MKMNETNLVNLFEFQQRTFMGATNYHHEDSSTITSTPMHMLWVINSWPWLVRRGDCYQWKEPSILDNFPTIWIFFIPIRLHAKILYKLVWEEWKRKTQNHATAGRLATWVGPGKLWPHLGDYSSIRIWSNWCCDCPLLPPISLNGRLPLPRCTVSVAHIKFCSYPFPFYTTSGTCPLSQTSRTTR